MPSITKPKIPLLALEKNELGLTIRDYDGAMSTLCAGCGHDSITAAIVRSVFELSIPPHRLCKLSGIGCSSKTPTYFVSAAHGFNSVHGRMAAIASGANAANRDLHYIGVSGDGDSLSIGLGHLAHAIRRNVDMLYVIADNGVYGLTKGQAAPTLKLNEKVKSMPSPNVNGEVNPVLLALAVGYTFVARAYAYDVIATKELIKQAVKHKGSAFIDILQPCPTYNDIETKEFYDKRVYKAEMDPVVKDQEDVAPKMLAAISKATEWGDRIPLGLFYRNELVSTYEERISKSIPNYLTDPPASQRIETGGVPITLIDKLLSVKRVV